MNKKTVMVTAAGGAAGLYTIEILKKTANWRVIGCDCDANAIGLYRSDKGYQIPNANEANFISEVNKIVEKEMVDVLVPNISDELPVFANHLSEVSCLVVISPLKTIDICHDKKKTLDFYREFVPVPQQYEYSKASGMTELIFIKPRISRGSANTFLVKDKNELEAATALLKIKGYRNDDLLFLEYLPGEEYTVDVLCDMKGKLIAMVPRKRLITDSGISILGETVADEKIGELIHKITKELTFFGPLNIQLKKDKEGTLKLQEINPRFSGGISLTARAGVNMPKLLLKIIDNEEISKQELQYRKMLIGRFYADFEIPLK